MRSVTLAAGCLVLVMGCNEPTTTIRGTVTTGGKPAGGVTVTFFPSNNRTFTADTDAEGRYAAPVTGRGTARVAVQAPPPRPKPRPDPPAGGGRDTYGRGEAQSDDKAKMSRMPPPSEIPEGIKLPDKYADPNTSGLTVTLSGPETVFDIKLD
jgi:hypothetical protein